MADIKFFETTLAAKEQELRRSLSSKDDIAIEYVADDLDNVVSRNSRELALAGRDRDTITLRRVLAARQRIRAGLFGECVECGKKISERRLLAVPWAERCIGCQESLDRTAKEQGEEFTLEEIA